MNKLKEIKDLIEDLKDCVDGNGVPNIHYISNRIADLDKVVNTINYIPCCDELNNSLQKGDSAYIYENAIVDIISVLPNNEYIVKDFSGIQFTADKKDLTKII